MQFGIWNKAPHEFREMHVGYLYYDQLTYLLFGLFHFVICVYSKTTNFSTTLQHVYPGAEASEVYLMVNSHSFLFVWDILRTGN